MATTTRENVRLVQVTGKSTYIVSLPKKWIDQVGLKRGEAVTIVQQNDKSLLVVPKSVKPPEKPVEETIATSSRENPNSLIRRIVSLYLIGYNTIKILTNEERIAPDQREMVKEFVRKKLVGTEIIADSRREMTLQILLSYPQLSVNDALRRMYVIASSMHRDAMTALVEKNDNLAKEVIQTDDEVDRFNFYIIRQLKAAVGDERIVREIGLTNPRDCLGYRLIAKSIERIADHAVSIARNILRINSPLDESMCKGFREFSTFAITGFDDAVKSLFTKDYPLADDVIERKRKIETMEREETAEILAAELDAGSISSLRLIVDSIRRTIEYASDIAEVVLNLTILEER
jgi:phosphate uptake regulator